MMPIYCRSAGSVLSVSDITREEFIKRLGVDRDKITTVYFAPGEQFNKRLTIDEIQAVRSKYSLPDEFILTLSGGVKDDRKNLYQSASLFLYPSNMEAFPIPITEALASGAPIVTSNKFGLKELAGDAALLVDPSSADEIANAALEVLSNDELSSKLRQKAQERAKVFTWDACTQKTLGLLEGIAGR